MFQSQNWPPSIGDLLWPWRPQKALVKTFCLFGFHLRKCCSIIGYYQNLRDIFFLSSTSKSTIVTCRNIAKCTIKEKLQRNLLATQFLVIMVKFGISYHDLNAKGPLMQFWLFHLFCGTM